MSRNLIFLFVLWIPYALCAQEKLKSFEQLVNKLDKKTPQLLLDFSVPGAAIAIIENGEIVLQKGYGFSDVEEKVKVSTKTGFNIASISKTVAAWGVMKLVQDGKIELDAPASTYLTRWQLPESSFNSNEVTIRRLLSHTAGLSLHGYPGWTPQDTLPTIEESLNGRTNGSGRVEIIHKPGTKYRYSGGGFTILQLIIEEVSGQKFEDYMQEQILNPLGMTNSSFKIDERIMAASASEYDRFGESTDFELFTAQAAAGLHTTIEDFTRFATANLYQKKAPKNNHAVLSPETIQQMMEPAPATNGTYGLGYQTLKHNLLKGLKGHSGGNTGWQSKFMVDPSTQDGFIVFTNGGAGYNIINMVYCEWISWNKGEEMWEGCNIQVSIANRIKQIIDDEGIENISKTYARIKNEQADKYNFAENQLNNLGYFYMARKEFEKAIAVFKTNLQAFPDAYNVYDSYGEALLAQGDREGAIENYKKSVELNPGNGNGVDILKELGVATEDLMDGLSAPVDSEVLAGYAGRYQTSAGEHVAIRMHEGKLWGDIDGQELPLMAQSTARFIAFGEGSIFSFFTSATGQKGLWVRQKIWQKLPNTIAVGKNGQAATLHSNGNFLVFRIKSSWDRLTDFENVLDALGSSYEQHTPEAMATLDLSVYDVIIIPGQQNSVYYNHYLSHTKRFDEFVAKGGTLILELNGATGSSMVLPRGVTLKLNPALENAILKPEHPIFYPLSGTHLMRARYASSGYLENIPGDAVILASEAEGENTFKDRPTFIEYSYGKGRVIAGLQCFHDRDGSGRGPLMESIISYSLTRSWVTKN